LLACASLFQTQTKRLLAAYHSALVHRPLATKALTSAIISALGDILASFKGRRNLRKTLSFFLFGGVIVGPLFHFWYAALERICKRIEDRKL
jgi:hypothetical protein